MQVVPSLESPRVIIVDDDAAVCEALVFALELEGFAAESLNSGEALLQSALPTFGTCLVIDQRLPGISGLDALLRLRRRHIMLPALLMTSYPSRQLKAAAEAVGALILEKPLLGDLLSDAIRSALLDRTH